MKPVVTIGLPFASTPLPFLEAAIRSVFAQRLDSWELLLIADGRDEPAERRIAAIDDPRVKVIADGTNRGLAARLNQISHLASSNLIARMDADDVMHPARLTRLVNEIEGRGADVVGSLAYAISHDSEVVGLFREPELPETAAGTLRSNLFTHPTVLARRDWMRANPYDVSLLRSEDKELWIRTFGVSRFAKVAEPLLYYRIADLTANKQARDARHDRAIVGRYGPGLVGRASTVKYQVRSRLKQAVFGAVVRSGRGRAAVMASKVAPVSDSTAARAGLADALGGVVPGWD